MSDMPFADKSTCTTIGISANWVRTLPWQKNEVLKEKEVESKVLGTSLQNKCRMPLLLQLLLLLLHRYTNPAAAAASV